MHRLPWRPLCFHPDRPCPAILFPPRQWNSLPRDGNGEAIPGGVALAASAGILRRTRLLSQRLKALYYLYFLSYFSLLATTLIAALATEAAI